MRRSIPLSVLALIIILAVWLRFPRSLERTPEVPLPSVDSRTEEELRLLQLVNEYRVAQGKSALNLYQGLCILADERSVETRNDWSHSGFFTRDDSGQIWDYCLTCTWIGENLAKDFESVDLIVGGWDNSPIHKEILLREAKYGCTSVEPWGSGMRAILEIGR